VFPKNPDGRIQLKRYLDDMPGMPLTNIWDDIPPIHAHAQERLGYPTQKPLALLERIIQASSNEGDLVLDPFCGCGTAVIAAEKLKRNWIGIDITHLAMTLIKNRLLDSFGEESMPRVIGEPVSVPDAEALPLRIPGNSSGGPWDSWAPGQWSTRKAPTEASTAASTSTTRPKARRSR